jgi:hypothetical protein
MLSTTVSKYGVLNAIYKMQSYANVPVCPLLLNSIKD